ncbi:CD209 antigen-like protein D [Cynoglossus semilaevis]|uniref:CD209 antigen-like protein D n=1 Tax=Cynoglossus semilaevis TaxID=244447 RepID=A0A3P8V9S4_CYNSE|nr:CD209 antigen-like protein D [Cynoglossus semilaevis]
MPDADIVYSDVKFKRSKDAGREVTSSPDVSTTYSDVKFSSPSTQQHNQRPAAEPSPQNKQRRGAVTLERVLLLIATLLLAAALAALAAVSLENRGTKINLEKLQRDLTNLTETQKKMNELNKLNVNPPRCPEPTPSRTSGHTCGRDWEHHGGKCYHFTKTNLTWNDSRERCTLLGGHLVMIESQEEQRYLVNKVKELMTTDEDKFWIGLTDAETENTWKWVDGSSLSPHLEFWLHNEPDNWTGQNVEGEDCVRLGEKGATTRNLRYWTDKSCTVPHKSICEKSLEKCTCF